jgi:hypothetical protein
MSDIIVVLYLLCRITDCSLHPTHGDVTNRERLEAMFPGRPEQLDQALSE